MMNSSAVKFIIEEIKNIAYAFPYVDFIYGFDNATNQHIIDIRPSEIELNDEFNIAESELLNNLMAKFPEEELFFISDDKFIRIENPLFIKMGTVPKIGSTPIALSSCKIEKISCVISGVNFFNHFEFKTIKRNEFPILNFALQENPKFQIENSHNEKLVA